MCPSLRFHLVKFQRAAGGAADAAWTAATSDGRGIGNPGARRAAEFVGVNQRVGVAHGGRERHRVGGAGAGDAGDGRGRRPGHERQHTAGGDGERADEFVRRRIWINP